MPYDDTWLSIHNGDQVFVWHLGQPTDEQRDRWIAAARVAAGFPPGHAWIPKADLSIHLHDGRPHDDLMNLAQVGTVDDLDAVDTTAMDAYVNEHTAAVKEEQVAEAKVLLTSLATLDGDAVLEALTALRSQS